MQFQKRENRSSGSKFLKIETDKPAIPVILRGEPSLFQSHFDNATKRSAECTGDGCSSCKGGSPSKDRFRINAIVREGEAYLAKIFEGNGFTYDYLASLVNDGWDLEKTVLNISKTGQGTQSKVMITPTPKVLPPETLNLISKVPLIPLTKDEHKSYESDPGFDPDNIPF